MYNHRGNALAALGREEEARESYEKVLPILDAEPRCSRIDWERCSVLVNIANSHSRQGKYDGLADAMYDQAEQLGVDHLEIKEGHRTDGLGIRIEALRFKAFALKKLGRDDEAKDIIRRTIEYQREYNELMVTEKKIVKEELAKQNQQEKEQQIAEAAKAQAAAAAAAAAAVAPKSSQ